MKCFIQMFLRCKKGNLFSRKVHFEFLLMYSTLTLAFHRTALINHNKMLLVQFTIFIENCTLRNLHNNYDNRIVIFGFCHKHFTQKVLYDNRESFELPFELSFLSHICVVICPQKYFTLHLELKFLRLPELLLKC